MNYIGEINAFERWLEHHPLELAPQLLMYKFYKLANRAGWPEWVSVDNLTLMVEMKTKREATVIAWRDRLIDLGLLEYRKGRKGVPNRYKIKSLYTCTTLNEANIVAQPVVESVVEVVAQVVAQTADLSKPKTETKTKKNKPPTPHGETAQEIPDDFSEAAKESIASWVSYKTEKNQKYKPEGFKKLVSQIRNNIAKYGESAVIEVIDECMAANYQGIIFDKLKNRSLKSANQAQPQEKRKSFSELVAERVGSE